MADGALTPSEIESTAQPDMAALGSAQAGGVVATCPAVTLEIGVFFDGTGNNERNAMVGGGEGSYGNARSNVSLLGALYYPGGDDFDVENDCGTGYATKYRPLYVPGIGTIDGDEARNREDEFFIARYARDAGAFINIVPDGQDDVYGSAMGIGPRGVEARVIQAALDVGRLINVMSPGIEPKEIILDVFGFSRGAAAARHFVNGFNAGRLDYVRWGLFNDIHARLPEGRNVTIRFVGIFDTVAAIGTNANDADNQDVNVHLSNGSAETIFHLTADDELRHSFSLNDTGDANRSANAGEIERLTGCHSNVGGGYSPNFVERPTIRMPETGIELSHAQAQAAQARAQAALQARAATDAQVFVNEGWITDADVPTAWKIVPEPITTVTIPSGLLTSRTYYLWKIETRLERPWVSHELSRVALKKMYEKAVAAGVPLKPLPTDGEYQIPDGLENASAAFKKRNYTHHSANYDLIIPIVGAPMREGRNRIRTVHPNNPGLAK